MLLLPLCYPLEMADFFIFIEIYHFYAQGEWNLVNIN